MESEISHKMTYLKESLWSLLEYLWMFQIDLFCVLEEFPMLEIDFFLLSWLALMKTMGFAHLDLWSKKYVVNLMVVISHKDCDDFELYFVTVCDLRTIAKLKSFSISTVLILYQHKSLIFSLGFISLAHKSHYFPSVLSFPFSNNFSIHDPHFTHPHAICLAHNKAFVILFIFFIDTDYQEWKQNCFIFKFFSISAMLWEELLFIVLSWYIQNNLICDLWSEVWMKVQWYQPPSLII